MENNKIRVAITHGDTNGVGYEMILKAFEDPTMLELCTPIIYGSPKVAAYHCKALDLQTQFSIINQVSEARHDRVNLLALFDEEIKVDIGHPSPEADEAASRAVQRALSDYEQGAYDVLVCAPSNGKEADGKGLTLLTSENLNIAFVTTQLAIKDVAEAITKPVVAEKLKILHTALKRDLRISNPRIAVLALNPKDANGELTGEEEKDCIAPAIDEMEQQGIQAFGPYQADEFFSTGAYLRFDAVLAMYYEQGMTPFKTIAREDGVRLTVGLDLVKASTLCTPDYTNAGKGVADPAPLRHAIYQAIDVWRHRREYDAPMGNPLPKLYHEKRDDSEKVRFAVPKQRREDKPQSDSEAAELDKKQ